RLSHRYIPARQLPDKAVSLLDTACARVAVSQHATPPEVEDCARRIEVLNTERESLEREASIGEPVLDRLAAVRESIANQQALYARLDERWQKEKALVDRILALRAQLREGAQVVDAPAQAGEEEPARGEQFSELRELQARLAEMQGDAPLILPAVDE